MPPSHRPRLIQRRQIDHRPRLTANSGGGLFNSDTIATLVNRAVCGNRTVYLGDGIANGGSTSVLTLYNVTVADNRAASVLNGTGSGGGVANDTQHAGTVVLSNRLLADNFASTSSAAPCGVALPNSRCNDHQTQSLRFALTPL